MNRTRLLSLLILAGLAAHSFAGQTNLVGAATAKSGRSLFLKNCAHCHGDDARGDEGPDLHGLKKSDEWITRRISNGVKGEMTAFGEKFSPSELDALIAYLRSLPSTNRTNLGPAASLGGGRFRFTDAGATSQPQRFYLLPEQ